MAAHSSAEPRAVAKYRARSAELVFPTASAVFKGIDSAARRN